MNVAVQKNKRSNVDNSTLFELQKNVVFDLFGKKIHVGEFRKEQLHRFETLIEKVRAKILNHPIITNNRYLGRFSQGVTLEQAKHELQQFSVFAIHFDVAQTLLICNSPTKDVYESRLKLLLNEKGIPYQSGFEGELTGFWKPETVHFSWLENMAAGLGMGFEEIGKLWLASAGTKQFVDTTMKTYGNVNPNISLGASFAIENWAANALWDPWISGMNHLNRQRKRKINLGYLSYHRAEEKHHSLSTLCDLLEGFGQSWFNEEEFFFGAQTVLTEGIWAYYDSQLRHLPQKDDTWPGDVTGTDNAAGRC